MNGQVSAAVPRWFLGFCFALVLVGHDAAGQTLDLPSRPDWRSYALVEALVLDRVGGAADRPLLVDGLSGATLVAPDDLGFPIAGGVRAFAGRRMPDAGGWEIGYFGLYGQGADASTRVSGDDFLQVPGPLGDTLTSEAQDAWVTWNSTINGAEFNLFSTDTNASGRHAAWHTVDWLLGFRWVGVEESARMLIDSCNGAGPLVPYGVRTSSNLFGPQVGVRHRLDWDRWAVEGWAKAALMGSALLEIQDPLVDWLDEPVPGRGTRSSWRDGGVGFVGDLNLSVVRRINDVWGLRAGYNLIWIEGIASAPDQFSFAANGQVRDVERGGGMFLHGANVGLEARW